MKSNDSERAAALLLKGEYTCVLCRGEQAYFSTQRGVKPLLDWLADKTDVSGFSAADRVVGRAAAYLYVLLQVRAVYAPVMSRAALDVFSRYGIAAKADTIAAEIRNRANTDQCPMELAVQAAETPLDALAAIQKRLRELSSH